MSDIRRYQPIESLINEPNRENLATEDGIRILFEKNKTKLLEEAIKAQADARHHSGVIIGCAISACKDQSNLNSEKILSAGNRKQKKGVLPWPKRQCGEMRVIKKAIEQGQRFIIAVVTASQKANTGEVETIHEDILGPCKQCQGMFRELIKKGVVSPYTQLHNTRVDSKGNILAHRQTSLGVALENWGRNNEEVKEFSLQDLQEVFQQSQERYLLGCISIKILENDPETSKNIKLLAKQKKLLKVTFETTVIRAVRSVLEEGLELEKVAHFFQMPLENASLENFNWVKIVVDSKIKYIDEIVQARNIIT